MDLALDGAKSRHRLNRVIKPLERVRVRLPRLPAEHLASSPRTSSRPPTPCSSRSSRPRCRSRTLDQLHEVLSQRRQGARLLLDGRPPQAAAPRDHGRARGRARHPRDGHPEQRGRRAHGLGARGGRGLRAAQQHQGRRRQDLGGGQPRHAGRPRGRPHAAVGPRPAGREHVPVPHQAQGQGRRRASSCAARPTSRRCSRAPTPRASTCCRRTSPTATWTSRSDDAKKPTSRLAPRARAARDDYEYTFLDCPPSISLVSESVFEAADALLVPIIPATLSSRTLEQLHERARAPRARRCSASSRWPTAARGCTAS